MRAVLRKRRGSLATTTFFAYPSLPCWRRGERVFRVAVLELCSVEEKCCGSVFCPNRRVSRAPGSDGHRHLRAPSDTRGVATKRRALQDPVRTLPRPARDQQRHYL